MLSYAPSHVFGSSTTSQRKANRRDTPDAPTRLFRESHIQRLSPLQTVWVRFQIPHNLSEESDDLIFPFFDEDDLFSYVGRVVPHLFQQMGYPEQIGRSL
jgi:hypothetical protein